MSIIDNLLRDQYFLGLSGATFIMLFLAHFYSICRCLVFPILGALIGYITNVLAVWMIFNPKKPKRFIFFKWHGLVPKSKNRISENLSTTVERELINPELIRHYIEANSADIRDSIKQYIQMEMRKDIPSLREILGHRYIDFKNFVLTIYESNADIFINLIDSLILQLVKTPLKDIMDKGDYLEIRGHLKIYISENLDNLSNTTIGDLLDSKDIRSFINTLMDRINEKTVDTLYEIFATKSIYDIAPVSEDIAIKFVNFVAEKLKDPSFRQRLAKIILDTVKEKENPVIKFLLEAVDIAMDLEGKVSDYLDGLSEKIENDPDLLIYIERSVSTLLRKPLSEYVPRDKFVIAILKSKEITRGYFHSNIDSISSRRLGEILPLEFIKEIGNRIVVWIDDKYQEKSNYPVLKEFYNEHRNTIINNIRQFLVSDKVKGLIRWALDRGSRIPIGNLEKRLPEGIDITKLVSDFVDFTFPQIVGFIGGFVEKINVKAIVKDRLDSLSVEELEDVVFGMMNKEFRRIEVLGIPIGGFVGLLQMGICFWG